MDTLDNILAVHNLFFSYRGQSQGLAAVTCGIPAGKKTAVLGPNGAGKSTLLLALAGVLRPYRGTVFFQGQPLDYSPRGLTRLRSKVGLVMQNPDVQVFCPCVYQEVAYGPTNLGLDGTQIRARVEWALRTLGCYYLVDRPVNSLSHGEKQRVAIAGVLAMRPSVLLLDEPTAGLDTAGVASLLGELERLQANGTTLVMTTHDLDLAWSWADHFIIMNRGTVTWEGEYGQLAASPQWLAGLGLGPPAVGVVFKALVERGLLPRTEHFPRNFKELLEIIEKSQGGGSLGG